MNFLCFGKSRTQQKSFQLNSLMLTAQKMKFFTKDFFIFTEEILNEKLYFLSSGFWIHVLLFLSLPLPLITVCFFLLSLRDNVTERKRLILEYVVTLLAYNLEAFKKTRTYFVFLFSNYSIAYIYQMIFPGLSPQLNVKNMAPSNKECFLLERLT